jgi:hypothetical protein
MRTFWLAGLTLAMISVLAAQSPQTPEQAAADAAKLAARAKAAQEQARRNQELAATKRP